MASCDLGEVGEAGRNYNYTRFNMDKVMGPVERVVKGALNKLEQAWAYVGKAISVTRLSLKSIAYRTSNPDQAKLDIATKIVGTSIISVILSPISCANDLQGIHTASKLGDHSGAAVAGLGAVTNAADTFDSFVGFSVAMQKLEKGFVYAKWFENVILPMSFVMCGLSVISNVVKLNRSRIFLNELNGLKNHEDFDRFLKNHIGLTPRDIAQLENGATEKAFQEWNLYKKCSLSAEEMGEKARDCYLKNELGMPLKDILKIERKAGRIDREKREAFLTEALGVDLEKYFAIKREAFKREKEEAAFMKGNPSLDAIELRAHKRANEEREVHLKMAKKHLHQKKVRVLSRTLSGDEVKSLEYLSNRVNKEGLPAISKQSKDFLRDVKTLQNRKIKKGCLHTAAMLLTIVALTFFYITPIGSFVTFGVLAILALCKFGLFLYEKHAIKRGLKLKLYDNEEKKESLSSPAVSKDEAKGSVPLHLLAENAQSGAA